jgi:hypothetical protein
MESHALVEVLELLQLDLEKAVRETTKRGRIADPAPVDVW